MGTNDVEHASWQTHWHVEVLQKSVCQFSEPRVQRLVVNDGHEIILSQIMILLRMIPRAISSRTQFTQQLHLLLLQLGFRSVLDNCRRDHWEQSGPDFLLAWCCLTVIITLQRPNGVRKSLHHWTNGWGRAPHGVRRHGVKFWPKLAELRQKPRPLSFSSRTCNLLVTSSFSVIKPGDLFPSIC
jgi:hypothetical protein